MNSGVFGDSAEPPAITILLAAGLGRRLGGPKALLAWPRPEALKSPGRDLEEPLACAHARVRLANESRRVLVVCRADVAAVLGSWPMPEGAECLVSDEPDEHGPAGSLAVAARRLSEEGLLLEARCTLLVTPVDCPPVAPAVTSQLLAALADREIYAARPRYTGAGGHPVALRGSLLATYLGSERPSLRELLRADPRRVRDIEVKDGSVLWDLDTPADYTRVTGSAARPRSLGARGGP